MTCLVTGNRLFPRLVPDYLCVPLVVCTNTPLVNLALVCREVVPQIPLHMCGMVSSSAGLKALKLPITAPTPESKVSETALLKSKNLTNWVNMRSNGRNSSRWWPGYVLVCGTHRSVENIRKVKPWRASLMFPGAFAELDAQMTAVWLLLREVLPHL